MDFSSVLKKQKSINPKEINLSGLKITSIPQDVLQDTEIESLKLIDNNISEIPYEIVNLKNLKELYLAGNQIKSISKRILEDLPELDCLDLGFNPFDYAKAAAFYYSNNKNKGHREASNKIARCKKNNDDCLFIHHEMRAFPVEIFELTQLKYLSIHGKEIKRIPEGISNLKNLTHLDLTDNKLSFLPEELLALTKLEKLVLITNDFDTFPDNSLLLSSIKELNISNNKLQTFPKDVFKHPTLESFYAFANPLVDFDEKLFNYDFKELKNRFN